MESSRDRVNHLFRCPLIRGLSHLLFIVPVGDPEALEQGGDDERAKEQDGEPEDHQHGINDAHFMPVGVVHQAAEQAEQKPHGDADDAAVLGAAPELGKLRRLRAVGVVLVGIGVGDPCHADLLL